MTEFERIKLYLDEVGKQNNRASNKILNETKNFKDTEYTILSLAVACMLIPVARSGRRERKAKRRELCRSLCLQRLRAVPRTQAKKAKETLRR